MIYRFVVDGGPWMMPILGASVIGLALSLERSWYWLVQALVRDRGLRTRLRSGDAPPPGQTVRDPVARVLVEAVRRPDDLGVASARAEAILRESKSYLGLLRFVGGTAALLGLLGTVFGARDVLHRTVDPAQINAGLANALHPTLLGLCIFLFVHTAAAAFQALTASLASELDEHLDDLARIIRRGPIVQARSTSADVALVPPASLAGTNTGGVVVAPQATPANAHATPANAHATPAVASPATVELMAPAANGAARVAASLTPSERVAVDRTRIARAEPAPPPVSSGPDAHELAQILAAAGGD